MNLIASALFHCPYPFPSSIFKNVLTQGDWSWRTSKDFDDKLNDFSDDEVLIISNALDVHLRRHAESIFFPSWHQLGFFTRVQPIIFGWTHLTRSPVFQISPSSFYRSRIHMHTLSAIFNQHTQSRLKKLFAYPFWSLDSLTLTPFGLRVHFCLPSLSLSHSRSYFCLFGASAFHRLLLIYWLIWNSPFSSSSSSSSFMFNLVCRFIPVPFHSISPSDGLRFY